MAIDAAYAVPHPPLIIPSVGGGQEVAIADTIEAFQEIARRTAQHNPDTIVIVSPHAPAYRDGFFISDSPSEEGSMGRFGQPQEAMEVRIDGTLTHSITRRLESHGIAAAGAPRGAGSLDHGAYVPLYFLRETLDLESIAVVRLGLSGLSDQTHRFVGHAIASAAKELDRSVVLIASGDWSHRLKEDGPYGFAPEGPVFDRTLADLFAAGDLEGLFTLDPSLCEGAAECGLRSFQIMAGALEGESFTAELLSYEGPYGVGYGVAAFEVDPWPSSSEEEAIREEMAHGEDPLVALARATVNAYVRTGNTPSVPPTMPQEYTHRKAGVFVSLHEEGDLRGCIGTIAPQRASIAEEVIANAVSASTADPRFPAITPDELDSISYSVDVLGEPEPADSLVELDPKHYGVIVSRGRKRGLLLPDLEGVETVMDQLAIAKRKAGIAAGEDCEVERFEVVRHSAGGEARCG